jgi:hypothetical protein
MPDTLAFVEDAPPDSGSTVRHRILALAAAVVAVAGIVAVVQSTGGDSSTRATGTADPTTTVGSPVTTNTAAPATTAGPVTPATTSAVTRSTATTVAFRPGGRVQVKFVEGSGVRLRDGRFVSVSGRDLSAVAGALARYPGTQIERLFSRPEEELAAEKAAVEASSGRPQADLNLYYRLTFPAGADVNTAIADLSRLAVVERAYADPGAAPPPAAPPAP